MSAKPKKNILYRIYEILAFPLLWVGERKPSTQKIIIICFFAGIIALTCFLHIISQTETSCKAKYDLCVQQYDACMEHAK